MTKRFICLLLSLLLLLPLALGCSKKRDDGKFTVICTVFPIYDWVCEILAGVDNVSVTLLVDSGTDPHSYNATAEDIAVISSSDMLIYVGGESDRWVEDAMKNAKGNAPETVRLIDAVEDRLHEHHGHSEDEECEDGHEHDAYDEHVWLSLKNAAHLTHAISERLSACLPDKAGMMAENTEKYISELSALDKELEGAVLDAKRRVLLFADRFPFRYLTEDYGLEYHAAFEGCSADAEASFETVISLTDKLNELDLPYVMVTETSDKRLARTVISGSDKKTAEILTLDSMQSISHEDISGGQIKYTDVMRENVNVLKLALG